MQFIEMTGKTLLQIVNEDGPTPDELAEVGVTDESIVRVNLQGDIELRRPEQWDIIGGLLGDYDERVRAATGLNWA
ncbi:MAG: hypothetical protein KJZ87_23165 [Thermoguttaceae bacterium]|nr:hypothetical protein [Thermoguttaceae bacterium]